MDRHAGPAAGEGLRADLEPTWNAYNNFGGRSNYVNQDGLPPRPVVHARTELKRFTQPGV